MPFGAVPVPRLGGVDLPDGYLRLQRRHGLHQRPVTAAHLRSGQVVIDIGINYDEIRQKLCGDVDHDAAEQIVDAISAVPGGIGAVTSTILASHVVEAAERLAE